MMPLPDIMVLDFCEWIRIEVSKEHREMDVLDIILDNEHPYELERYAENFLAINRMRYPVKALLHRFIDSSDFDECLKHCKSMNDFYLSFLQNGNKLRNRIYPEDLWRFLDECRHCRGCYKYFDKFLYGYQKREQDIWSPDDNVDISPSDLARYVRYSVEHDHQNPKTLKLMQVLKVNFSDEINFLEWLIQEENLPMKLSQMPLEVFEALVNEYQQSSNINDKIKNRLIKSFKQSDSDTFTRKLLAVLPLNTAKKAKSLGYIVDRYSNRKIPYKCLILPLGTKEALKVYQDFIKKSWKDLHLMSGDSLDIYYSEVEYGKSGYEILNALHYIPQHFNGNLPCIVLWQDDMSKAKPIHIGRLKGIDIFEVFSKIVFLIEENVPFETIVIEAEKLCAICLKKHRPILSAFIKGDNNIVTQTFE